MIQLLSSVGQMHAGFTSAGRCPAIIMTGDLNISTRCDLRLNLVYKAIKEHRFGLRSVLTDDVVASMVTGRQIYTTWKVRKGSSRKHSNSRHINTQKDEGREEKDGRRADGTTALIGEIEAVIGDVDNSPKKPSQVLKKMASHDDSDSDNERSREHVSKGIVDFIFYTPLRVDQPGFRTLSILDMLELEHIGGRRLPNEVYPSDHIAICAEFQFLW
jgi:hypothetical protein